MKFLADMGVSITTVKSLRTDGYDAVHLREQDLIRLPDPEIVAKAVHEGRIVLTFDLDFGDILAAAGNSTPSVIIFRGHAYQFQRGRDHGWVDYVFGSRHVGHRDFFRSHQLRHKSGRGFRTELHDCEGCGRE